MHHQERVALVDIARTLALLAMGVFHFNYDMELFGYTPSGTMLQPAWVWTARVIAGSFILLSGLSLVLAARGTMTTLPKTLKRLAMIGGAAALVSIGTYFAIGDGFVRFGILHLLFAANLIGLLALRLPYWLNSAFGLAIAALPLLPNWPILTEPAWLWLARTRTLPVMVDYVPLAPWLGVFLIGMAVAQLMSRMQLWQPIASAIPADTKTARLLSWPGQHSLAIYLLHQPILFAGFITFGWLTA